MGDPYRIYFTPTSTERGVPGSVARPSFPGYMSSEMPSLLFDPTIPSTEPPQSYSSDFLQRDIRSLTPGAYGVDNTVGIRLRPEPALGVAAATSVKGDPSLLEVPSLLSQRQDVAAVSIGPGVSTYMTNERLEGGSLRDVDALPALKGESNVLFVDGLPTDCTRREVGHIFRPFIGFKEIKVVHKEPRRSGDKAMVLCFVEFADPKCALTAMKALQGYKFDDKKPDSPALRIQFAHFPFRHPAGDREQQNGIPR